MADKGLKSNVVGLFGGTMLGISLVAPAYALTATFGILAASVGLGLILIGPVFLAILRARQPAFFAARRSSTSRRTRTWPSTNTC
jgi:hypothetical protein